MEVIFMAGGRPKKEYKYDKNLIRDLASVFCTQEEIASIMGVSYRTLQRDEEFCRLYEIGRNDAKNSLRRAQFNSALKGNATLLVWLGKQYLGQKDIITVGNNDEIEDDPLTKAIKKSMAKNQLKDDNT